MITLKNWFDILEDVANQMKKAGTTYDWKKPITLKNCLKQSTCIGFVASAMQEAKLLPKGKYVHMQPSGELSGNGLDYIKKHNEKFKIFRVDKTPKALKDDLKPGDICLYNTPHIQVYYGKNESGAPLWFSLEHKSGQKKAILTIKDTFPFYSKRKINVIIRPIFEEEPSSPNKKPKYKFNQKMNLRSEPNGNAQIVGHISKGATKSIWEKKGVWGKVKQNGEFSWVNISSKYAEKAK